MIIVTQTATSNISLHKAMQEATAGVQKQLASCTGDIEKLSVSHSSGFFSHSGYFVTIIATVPAKTPEPGIASMF